ncbi:MAG: N-acetylmuramoyl-L-alanine amidase, partial [Syntrophomonadaceae bacterium]|nr:N-acetylmuramoyl-L-alanine amidase [Syntrophomonadaceae bacterium]
QTSRGIAWLAGGLGRVLTPPPAIAHEIESPDNSIPVEEPPFTPTDNEIPLPGEIDPNPVLPSVPRVARVVLDPGHGGRDPGAIGITGSYEKDVNLAISNKAAEMLKKAGMEVIMTRSDDRYVTVNSRVDIANAANAAIFVSIHSNSTTNSETNGTMLYYYVDHNILAAVAQASDREQLARIMQNSLVQSLQRADKGVRQNNYVVIRYTEIPAILVETAYLSNLTEEMLLNDYAFQDRAAQAITDGIIKYFSSKGIN